MITETTRVGPSYVYRDLLMFRKALTWNEDKHVMPEFAQEKLDGIRVVVYRGGVYTTRGHNIQDQAQLPLDKISDFGKQHLWDGELMSASGTREDVKTALKTGDVTFRPFATSACSEGAALDLVATAIAMHTPFKHVPFYKAPGPFNADIEGYVYKSGNYGEWFKWKHEATLDAVVTSVKDGKGANKGLVGSLICSVYTPNGHAVEVANVSGMTKKEREQMTADGEESLVGRVVEIKYQRVGSRGRLIHPRFLWFRNDKLPQECTTHQDPVLHNGHC